MGLLALLLFSWAGAQAPSDGIAFDKLVHDFGPLKEEQGEATYTFNFKNTGKSPLKLTDVKASCGCTTPQWTRDAVAPGAIGTITATYSTTGRPGEFNKTITVKSKADDQPDERITVLTIKGNVAPRPKTVADYYPTKFGNLRASTNHVNFAKLYPGTRQTTAWKLLNEGTAPVTIREVTGAPAHVSVALKPGTVIAPGDSLAVEVGFDGAKQSDWGWVYHNLTLKTDDTDQPEKPFFVSAVVEENFSAWTPEQKANAPEITFEKTTHEFGSITAGQAVTTQFKFTNTGKSDLVIRKTKASCGCTATEPDKSVLKPGESSHITVTYDSTGKRGKESKSVTVISNDPKRFQMFLTINADVQAGGATGSAAPATGGK